MESKQQGIQVRMRGDLAHTLKDGWRVSETSVTVEFLIQTEDGYEIGMDIQRHAGILERAHEDAYYAAQKQAIARNQADQEVKDAKRQPDRPE